MDLWTYDPLDTRPGSAKSANCHRLRTPHYLVWYQAGHKSTNPSTLMRQASPQSRPLIETRHRHCHSSRDRASSPHSRCFRDYPRTAIPRLQPHNRPHVSSEIPASVRPSSPSRTILCVTCSDPGRWLARISIPPLPLSACVFPGDPTAR